jgi:hypothetical protein
LKGQYPLHMSQYTKSDLCPIIDFHAWAPVYATWYVKRFLKLKRRTEFNTPSTRWEHPDPGYFDDAVSYAVECLYKKKDHIQSAKFPKQCAKHVLRKMGQNWSQFSNQTWLVTEWDNRKMREARVQAERLSSDEGEIHRIQREKFIEGGGSAHVFDTIYGEPLQLFDETHPEGGIDPEEDWFQYETWDSDGRDDPAEEIVGQRSFIDYLEDECDQVQRDFLELCIGRSDIEVAEILHEHSSSTGRRKRKILEAYRTWLRAAGDGEEGNNARVHRNELDEK